MEKKHKCPICNSSKSTVLFSVEGFPCFTAPIKKEDKKIILKKYSLEELQGKLEPVVCRECSQVYLSLMSHGDATSELYSKYYSYPSALLGAFVPERDNLFLEIFNEKIKKHLKPEQVGVLEIGCYDGYILHNLKKRGFDVAGCDPSDGADIGQRFGLAIKKRFYDTEQFVAEGLNFDIIIFRHFLEHLSEPVAFLVSLNKILKPSGLVVFEVPNVEYALKNGNPSVFSFQHLQYFSSESIFKLLEESGLKLVELIDSGENLIVACSIGNAKRSLPGKSILRLCSSFQDTLKIEKLKLTKMLKGMLHDGIVIWGAGGFNSIFLKIFGILSANIRFMVDSDKKKWQMEFLDHSVPIKPLSALNGDGHAGLVVCSMYADQIMRQLDELQYNKPIIKMYPRVELYKEKSQCLVK